MSLKCHKMYNILIVGMTGEGKSEVVKDMIRNRPCFVFDLNDEYGRKTKYPGQVPINLSNNTENKRSRVINGDFEKFIKKVKSKKETIVVFEEATGFLEGKVGKEFKLIVVNKMFTKNVYIFIFHSIIDVPPFIMRISNYIVLHKTNDEEHYIDKKYPRLLPYFLKLKKQPNGSKIKIKMI